MDISVIDFALRVDGRLIRPAEPRTIAVRNQKQASRRTRHRPLAFRRGFDGNMGNRYERRCRRGCGRTTSRACLNGPGSSRDGNRTRRSRLRDQIADKPVAGYVYFPVGETKVIHTTCLSA